VACLLALVVALVVWALTSGGGGSGGHGASAPTGSHTPAATITAGPAPTGTHISGRPGGRDTAPSDTSGGGGGSNQGGQGSSGGGTAGDGSSGGGSTAGSAGSGGSATGGSAGGAVVPGQEVPVGSTLPDCSPGPVALSLASVRNSYAPGQDPEFRLQATNSGDVSCKVDFGPKSAVLTVSEAPGSSHVWASDDCPTTGAHLLQVPAHSTISFTVRWNGTTSSPNCAKPKGAHAQPGTYLVQLQMAGYGTKQTSFQLSQD
jgi:hypothetical protein